MGRQSGLMIVCFVLAHVALVLFIVSLSTHDWIRGTTHYHLNMTTTKKDSIKPWDEAVNNSLNNHTTKNHTSHNHTTFTLFNMTRTCTKGFWKLCCDDEGYFWYNHTYNHTIEVSEVIKLPVYVLHNNHSNNHSLNWTECHKVDVMGHNTTGWFRSAMFCCAFSVVNMVVANLLLYTFLLVTRFKRSVRLVIVMTLFYFVATCELVVSVLMMNIHHKQDPDFSAGYDTSLAWSSYLAISGACVGAVTAIVSIGIIIVVKANAAPYESLSVQS